jgi:hypothetical protein
VLSPQLSNWAEDVAEDRCTVNEPNDRVRLALITYKREWDSEEEEASKPLSVTEQLPRDAADDVDATTAIDASLFAAVACPIVTNCSSIGRVNTF